MRCIALTKKLERCKNNVEHGNFLFCHLHRRWWLIAITTIFISGTTIFANIATIRGVPFVATTTPSPSQTPTPTFTPSRTSTPTSTITSTPKAQGVYYMIVLDASAKMNESFDGRTKWQAALNAVTPFIEGFEPDANYGLVVVGGEPLPEDADPCDEPSSVKVPFSSQKAVSDQITLLQPGGGGSLFEAFVLAKNQFENLPENTVRMLIYITGSSDACEDRDEWDDLERLFRGIDDSGLKLYSEIIVLENDGLKSRNLEEQFDGLSNNLNVQAPTNFIALQQTSYSVINNVTNNVNIIIASQLTNVPTTSPTITRTQRPGDTSVPSLTPTLTRTSTPTSIPVLPTNTLFPEILYITYPQNNQALNCAPGSVCSLNVTVQWIPDSQRQGRNLSVWVRPIPDLPDNCGQEYWPQNSPKHNGNGVWSVLSFIGDGSEPPGTKFSIYALITDEVYTEEDVSIYLPSPLNSYRVNLTRGVGNPEVPTCP